jgi:AcrR family transcriptional regulator
MALTDETRSQLRSDAERNRGRIVAAARRAYAVGGLSVSMAAVAREAGVGIATVFRHFPTREELIAAVFADTMDTYLNAAATALEDPDPWHGFIGYVETVCAMQAADRGFADVLTMTFLTTNALADKRAEAYWRFTELIDRAKASGRLRPDFSPVDLVILLLANAGVIAATADEMPDAWRRLVGYMLQAFAVHDSEAMPAAPDTARYQAAFVRGQRWEPADTREQD